MSTIVMSVIIGIYVKQVEFRCELNSNSVTNHQKHITSMAEYIKPLFWKD